MPNDVTTNTLVGLLDTASLRHKVLLQNLANVSTPGYLRQDIDFDKVMEAISSGEAESVAALKPEVFVDKSAPVGSNGNSVQADMEMSELSKNSLLYQFGLRLLDTKMALARMAITGRS